jgi:hypothetical protein
MTINIANVAETGLPILGAVQTVLLWTLVDENAKSHEIGLADVKSPGKDLDPTGGKSRGIL